MLKWQSEIPYLSTQNSVTSELHNTAICVTFPLQISVLATRLQRTPHAHQKLLTSRPTKILLTVIIVDIWWLRSHKTKVANVTKPLHFTGTRACIILSGSFIWSTRFIAKGSILKYLLLNREQTRNREASAPSSRASTPTDLRLPLSIGIYS